MTAEAATSHDARRSRVRPRGWCDPELPRPDDRLHRRRTRRCASHRPFARSAAANPAGRPPRAGCRRADELLGQVGRGARSNTRATGFHLLQHGKDVVLRTRDLERLVQGLVSHLDSNRPVVDGVLRARAVALVGERGALVAPAILRQYLAQVERRLNVRGVRIADPPYVSIDWQEREVVVPRPALDLDWSALDQLSTVRARCSHRPGGAPGSVPHDRLGLPHRGTGAATLAGPGDRHGRSAHHRPSVAGSPGIARCAHPPHAGRRAGQACPRTSRRRSRRRCSSSWEPAHDRRGARRSRVHRRRLRTRAAPRAGHGRGRRTRS